MKKISIMLAMAAVALGFTSCKQEEDPKYKVPTSFTIATPALQNTAFRCADDMTDPATFNLFCTQPDYGYAAICNYSALVTLDAEEAAKSGKDIDLTKWVALANVNTTSAQMAVKTFDLGAAVNKLSNITSEEEFIAQGIADKEFVCYFKAVCEIPNIESSYIISDNSVTYNKVMTAKTFTELKPGWIYICGDVQNADGSQANGFLAPSSANYAAYKANWALYEPEDMIGEKLYVGTFYLTPKEEDPSKSYEDNCSQFRFFTDLVGWSTECSLGSNEADFYCKSITDKWEAGYDGDVIDQGLGNWGIWICDRTAGVPFTVVVDVNQLKIYVKEGVHKVNFVGRDPEFE